MITTQLCIWPLNSFTIKLLPIHISCFRILLPSVHTCNHEQLLSFIESVQWNIIYRLWIRTGWSFSLLVYEKLFLTTSLNDSLVGVQSGFNFLILRTTSFLNQKSDITGGCGSIRILWRAMYGPEITTSYILYPITCIQGEEGPGLMTWPKGQQLLSWRISIDTIKILNVLTSCRAAWHDVLNIAQNLEWLKRNQ